MAQYKVVIEKVTREVWVVESRSKGDAAYSVGRRVGEQIEDYPVSERIVSTAQIVLDESKLPLA